MLLRFAFFLRVPVLLFIANAYVLTRLLSGAPTSSARLALIVGVTSMYLILIAGFMFRHDVTTRLTDKISWVSFIFLGFFSWLFVLTFLRDVVLILAFITRQIFDFNHLAWYSDLNQISMYVVVGGSLLATLFGLFNARRLPAVVEVDVIIPHLPSSLEGFTIAQITDLHVGPTIKKDFVKKVVEATNQINADVIVLTGDLIDGDVASLREHTNELAQLKAIHGVFGVTGNHEYYSGANQWIAEYQRLGMRVLQNEHAVIHHAAAAIVLAGVTDFGAGKFDASHTSDPKAALQNSPANAAIKILLAHQPRSMFAAEAVGFDLQMSGHTHGGQFWPWGYFVPLQQPLVAGLHQHKTMQIYISQGTGYWGPPMRLGARSEISKIRLRA